MKKCFAEFNKRETKDFYLIELSYENIFHWFSKLYGDDHRGKPWFCRLWRRNFSYGWAYGKTKFEAYRKALTDLNTKEI